MVYVCPEKDIVCGDREAGWCLKCPARDAALIKSAVESVRLFDTPPQRELCTYTGGNCVRRGCSTGQCQAMFLCETVHEASDVSQSQMECTGDLEARLSACVVLLKRYVSETPLGHQPHMIALAAEAEIQRSQAVLLHLAVGEQPTPPQAPEEVDPQLPRKLLDVACRMRVGETLYRDDELVDAAAHALRTALATQAEAVEVPGCNGLDTPERVRFYEHDFYVLSNFSAFRVCGWGRDFDTAEHAYHWHKFQDHPHMQDQIQMSASAHEAFKFAEAMKSYRRRDWDEVKVGIMRDILRAKADQHEYVRRKLLATGDRELVEDSWRDDFWGWGPNRDGKNMLGKLWMEVRAELRATALAGKGKV